MVAVDAYNRAKSTDGKTLADAIRQTKIDNHVMAAAAATAAARPSLPSAAKRPGQKKGRSGGVSDPAGRETAPRCHQPSPAA